LETPEPAQEVADGDDQVVVLQGELLEDNADNVEGEERAAS
jgi:hypothetical protein